MDRVAARDAIYSIATAGASAAFVQVLGKPGFIRYAGVKDDRPATIPNDVYWAQFSIQTVDDEQETLRNNERRFLVEGIVFVQLFVPVLDEQGLHHLDLLSEAIRNVFRRRAPGDKIEFTRARIVDNIKPEPNWLRANVVSEFQYRQFM